MVCLACHPPERKAQQPLFVFLPVYPELVGVVGSRVPDYRGRFLRGLQSGHSVGQTVANSLKSHNHTQPTHTHSFSGQLVSTALSGTAAGNPSLLRQISESAVGCWTIRCTSGGAGGRNLSDGTKVEGEVGSPSVRQEMMRESLEAGSLSEDD